jgi:hypothetical protein
MSFVWAECLVRGWLGDGLMTEEFPTWLIDWLIDYDGVRVCIRTAATNGPNVYPPGDMWAWRTMVMIMPAGDKNWLVHQSSLAVLPAETSRESRRIIRWLRIPEATMLTTVTALY